MAHLWIQKLGDAAPRWAAVPLAGWAYYFVAAEPYVRRADATPGGVVGEMLVRSDHAGAESWFVLASDAARLWVNGCQAPLGIRVLADRDEIRLASGPRLYFSTERPAKVVPFPGADREVLCGRCRTPLAVLSPAVECSVCGTWCHQRSDLPCWWYKDSPRCPCCGQSCDPEGTFRWTPADP